LKLCISGLLRRYNQKYYSKPRRFRNKKQDKNIKNINHNIVERIILIARSISYPIIRKGKVYEVDEFRFEP
jgi:hypothetical protein